MKRKKILVVCLGNICRSPIAEGLFQRIIDSQNLDWSVDSAGTSGWHDGEGADSRSIDICRSNGVDISRQVSRKIHATDFVDFDVIIAMDDKNLRDVKNLTPLEFKHKIHRMMDFLPKRAHEIVPDPYYDNRFKEVFDLLEEVIDASIPVLSSIFQES